MANRESREKWSEGKILCARLRNFRLTYSSPEPIKKGTYQAPHQVVVYVSTRPASYRRLWL